MMEPATSRQTVISLDDDLMGDSCLETRGSREIEFEMDCVWADSRQEGGYSHLNKFDINYDIWKHSMHSTVLISVATGKNGSILIKNQK